MSFINQVNHRGIIADDMGLGKTLQAIAYCQYHHTERPVLIIVPGCVKYKWQREIVKWIQNQEIQNHPAKPQIKITGDIVIINYDIRTIETCIV